MSVLGPTKRKLTPELLDELPPNDPGALRSRKDLRRINAFMGNAAVMAHTLIGMNPHPNPLPRAFARSGATFGGKGTGGPGTIRLLELGCGDGFFLLQLAQRLGPKWQGTHATLLDRQPTVDPVIHNSLTEVGWKAEVVQEDVFAWFARPDDITYDVIIANLFIHHFEGDALRTLLAGIAQRSKLFVAVEPRRSRPALFFSRLVWMMGCNSVTQHDARVSVEAGFSSGELSDAWPCKTGWELEDRPYGWSNHLFVARRTSF